MVVCSFGVRYATGLAVYRIEVHRRLPSGQNGAMFYMSLDPLIAQFLEEVPLPVPLEARRIEGVEHTLQHRKGHRDKELERRRPIAPEWFQDGVRLLNRALVTPHDAAHVS